MPMPWLLGNGYTPVNSACNASKLNKSGVCNKKPNITKPNTRWFKQVLSTPAIKALLWQLLWLVPVRAASHLRLTVKVRHERYPN
jgi:hypothetical protein